jgi:asparagine synthase (glutamine-hydrolysing)
LSGIVGVFGLDGRPVEVSEVRRMSAASGDPPVHGEDFWVGSAFGVGYQHERLTPESLTEAQPLVSPSQTVVCFDGRLDNRDELAHLCPSNTGDAPRAVSDAALVLAAYQQFGDQFAARLNGDFALALFDASRRQLLLARDVMAARRLHYCPVPGALLFASQIKSLLADSRVSASPDEDGLADLVLNNWYDEHRTCFKGIYSVPAGQMLVATPDGVALRTHWAFDPSREIRYRSFDEYRDAFRALFEQSVRRRLRSAHPVAVTVSGGVDSSSIFCQAATLVRRESLPVALHGIALTFPAGTPADEQAFLGDIERTYGATITRIPVSHLEFLRNTDALVRHLETPSVPAHTYADVFECGRAAGCRVILNGYFGDQMLFDRGYLVDLARRGRWLKIRHDLREFAAWMTDEDPGIFEREFRSRVLRALPPRWLVRVARRGGARWRARARYSPLFTSAFRERARLRAKARSVTPVRSATEHAEQYFRHATAGHYVNSVRLESGIGVMHGVDVRYPFRDRDLVAFLMAIPGDIVNWQGVPKGLLRHALTGVLPDAVRDRRWKADFTEVNRDAAERERPHHARLVPRNALSVRAGLVDGERLAQGALVDWQLADPIGLEFWLRNFFGGSPGAA